jgi:hypothetical protein
MICDIMKKHTKVQFLILDDKQCVVIIHSLFCHICLWLLSCDILRIPFEIDFKSYLGFKIPRQ